MKKEATGVGHLIFEDVEVNMGGWIVVCAKCEFGHLRPR